MAFDADEQVEDEIDDDELEPQDGDGEFEDDEEEGDEPAAAKEPTVEDIAREMGWTPKDKWRGDPRKHVGAAEFVRNGAAWRKEYNREVKELREQLSSRSRITEEALARLNKRHEAELKAARREAIRAGDADRVDAIDAELEQVRQPVLDEETQAEIGVQQLFESEPEVALFWEENAWALEDEALADRLIRFWDTDDPGKPFDHARAVERAERYLKKAYPERFGQPAAPAVRRQPPNYADPGARSRGQSWSSRLTDDELKEARSLVKEKLFKSVEEYAEVLFENRGIKPKRKER